MELDRGSQIAEQLRAREPIFHHAPAGATHEVFEAMTAADYWEVGASGRVYDRAFVIQTLVDRHACDHDDPWTIDDFAVRALAADVFLATYQLDQAGRRSRRATVWRRTVDGWIAEYHQGTVM